MAGPARPFAARPAGRRRAIAMDLLIVTTLLFAVLRSSTPLLLAALGGLISQRAGIWNIALEGFMLTGAFAAVLITAWTGNPWLGVLAACVTGIVMAMIMALFVVILRADEIIVGIALNLASLGVTQYLLVGLLGQRGSYLLSDGGLPPVELPLIDDIPVVGDILSGHSPLVYLSLVALGAVAFLVYRTHFGLALRAVGEAPDAATASGIDVPRIKALSLVMSGALAGLGGAQLSIGFLSLFGEDMTAGRGIVAFAAVIFGNAHPFFVWLATLVFATGDAVATRMQGINIPLPFILMVPYLLTIIALAVAGDRRRLRRN